MNDNEIERVAAAINALRPDWPSASLRTLITNKLGSRPRRDVAVALTWVACDSTTKTPARVLEAGPWWRAAAFDVEHVQRPPRKSEDCPKHPGNWRDSCHGCAADRLADDDTTYNPRRTQAGDRIATLRGLLSTAKANLCPCGIDPRLCADHDPRTTEGEAK